MTWSFSKLLRHLLQALATYLAVWVSLSRISDYKHHWSDVLSGAILGCLVACITVCSSVSLCLALIMVVSFCWLSSKNLRYVELWTNFGVEVVDNSSIISV